MRKIRPKTFKIKLKTPSIMKKRMTVKPSGKVYITRSGKNHNMYKRNTNTLRQKNKAKHITVKYAILKLL